MTRLDVAEAIRRRRSTMARRSRATPRPLAPDGVQREYLRELRAMMKALGKMVREELDSLPAPRADAPADGTFGDPAPDDSALRQAIMRAAARWFRRFPMATLERLGRRIAKATSEHQRREWTRQVRAAIGVDPTLSEPWLLPEIESFGRENANLITRMAQETIEKIQTHVTAATLAGDRHETLAKVLQERLQVSESRAKLIARDQVLSFTADLAATRQQAAGVTEYIWRTVNDNRVRPTHEPRNGQRFRWAEPPPGGHPGTEVLCRCYAEPVIDLTFGLGGPQPGGAPTASSPVGPTPRPVALASRPVRQSPVQAAVRRASTMPAAEYDRRAQSFAADLSPAEQEAISAYQEARYRRINEALRRGVQVPDTDRARETMEAIDAVFVRQPPLTQPVQLNRGVDFLLIGGESVLRSGGGAPQVGTSFVDPGFVSTTSREGRSFAGMTLYGDKDYHLVIEAQPGVRIAPVSGVSPLGMQQAEKEILLPRGLRYTVVGTEEREGRHGKIVRVVRLRAENP